MVISPRLLLSSQTLKSFLSLLICKHSLSLARSYISLDYINIYIIIFFNFCFVIIMMNQVQDEKVNNMELAPPSDHLCYVRCNFCSTVLAVHISYLNIDITYFIPQVYSSLRPLHSQEYIYIYIVTCSYISMQEIPTFLDQFI